MAAAICECGKKTTVPDTMIGRDIRCPGCGRSNTAVGTRAANAPAAGKTKSKAAPASAAERAMARSAPTVSKNSGLSINWGFVGGIFALLLAVAVIIWYVGGPVANDRKWTEKASDARGDVEDVIQRALAILTDDSMPPIDPDTDYRDRPEPPPPPRIHDITFIFNGFRWGYPDKVTFRGVSSMGEFKGVYHLDGSDRVVATVDTGGVVLPSGVVASAGGGDKIEIDGSSVEGKLEITINGKRRVP